MVRLVQRSDVGEFRRRYKWLVLFIVGIFLFLASRLFQLQILEGDLHEAEARRNIIGETRLATTRGVIRDAHKKVLASNRPAYNVYVVPISLDREKVWPRIVQLMGLSRDEVKRIEERLDAVKGTKRESHQLLVRVDVDRDIVAALKTVSRELKGLRVRPSPVRAYPYGVLASHAIGYMREVDADTLAARPEAGYRAGDRIGAVGVERRWESYLRGQRGFERYIRKKARRERVEDLQDRYLGGSHREEPRPGRDISLSLDIELVAAAEEAMRGHLAGAVVVLDVRTGRVLAALSKPSFDPNVVSGGKGKKAIVDAFRRYYSDPLKPTLDRTISAAYPPGSTYKPFSALSGLQSGDLTRERRVECRGGFEYGKRYFRCTGVHRQVNLHSAMVQSCNTYFYDLGSRIPIDTLARDGSQFGFGAKTGIGVNPEARGRMPTRAWYSRRYKGAFRGGFTLLAAIGQGATTVNVLQLALAYGALANGGTLYRPQVVRSIETSDGMVVQDFPPRVRRLVEIDRQQLSWLRDSMHGVVEENRGTAFNARIAGVDIAGKTGTAQVTQSAPRGTDQSDIEYFVRSHAWFAGYAPHESPEIAIVVLVEHGGGGGKNAAPVAMKVVKRWQELKDKRLGRLVESEE
ncbi:MAG: penicillin-binding protein 2 [Polyangiaceae bacterium]|nr:penicillin-binding protein 2 [Polyangiaceae bacterium]